LRASVFISEVIHYESQRLGPEYCRPVARVCLREAGSFLAVGQPAGRLVSSAASGGQHGDPTGRHGRSHAGFVDDSAGRQHGYAASG